MPSPKKKSHLSSPVAGAAALDTGGATIQAAVEHHASRLLDEVVDQAVERVVSNM